MSWHLIDEVRDFHFQLPLSGSRGGERHAEGHADGRFQLPLSGSLGINGPIEVIQVDGAFNSLSRDHKKYLSAADWRDSTNKLSTPSLGITNMRL